MRRSEHQVPPAIDGRTLLDGVTAPQHEHDAITLVVKQLHDPVGKALPAFTLVRTRLPALHRQHRIQQQHTLPRHTPLFSQTLAR